MKARIRIEYFEMLDHWSWEVTVGTRSAYSVEQTYEDARDRVRDQLEDMLEGKDA